MLYTGPFAPCIPSNSLSFESEGEETKVNLLALAGAHQQCGRAQGAVRRARRVRGGQTGRKRAVSRFKQPVPKRVPELPVVTTSGTRWPLAVARDPLKRPCNIRPKGGLDRITRRSLCDNRGKQAPEGEVNLLRLSAGSAPSVVARVRGTAGVRQPHRGACATLSLFRGKGRTSSLHT